MEPRCFYFLEARPHVSIALQLVYYPALTIVIAEFDDYGGDMDSYGGGDPYGGMGGDPYGGMGGYGDMDMDVRLCYPIYPVTTNMS